MYKIIHHTGKLVEIRIWSPVSIDEAVRWAQDHEDAIREIGGPYVCFVDVVDATVFPQDVADAYVATMKNEPRLQRTGVLLNQSPTLGLQVQRMIRESNHPSRKVFRDPSRLEAWLDDVLDPYERRRLRDVLAHRMSSVGPQSWRMRLA
jgi:hypothetical protein